MRRFIAACLEMVALWLWPPETAHIPWSVVWSDSGPELASRDLGSRWSAEEAFQLMQAAAPEMCDRNGGTVYVVDPSGKVLLSYSGRRRPQEAWLARMGSRSPN